MWKTGGRSGAEAAAPTALSPNQALQRTLARTVIFIESWPIQRAGAAELVVCAGHVSTLGGESPLSSQVEAKDKRSARASP